MSGKLEIRKIGITELDADCIVNAANSGLRQGGGVCGAIFAAAGPRELQAACDRYPGCPTGSAVLTPGFRLRARYIAHAVGPVWNGGHSGEPEQLYSAYQSALRLAAEQGCRTIAFPLISSGIYGYPAKEAWQVAVRSILDFQKDRPAPDAVIAVISEEMYEMGTEVLKDYLEKLKAEAPHLNVKDLDSGMSVQGYYILQSASPRVTASGKPFLSASVSDKTGSVPVIIWDYRGPIGADDDGKAVYIQGRAAEFKGSLQVTMDQIRLAEQEDPVDPSVLVSVAPIDEKALYEQVLSLVESIGDPDYKAICQEFIRRHGEAFRTIPAAKSVHHSFLRGLLMHTGNMLKTADFLSGLYRDTVNRDLLLAGTFLHDFSKREEFTFSGLGLVTGYSVKGQLLGHLVMGAQEVCEIGKTLGVPEEKSVLLQHMLLSHHGKPEYGAAVVPVCAESDLLSMIDMMDSHMEIYRENLERVPLGQFTDRIFALDGSRAYCHYKPE